MKNISNKKSIIFFALIFSTSFCFPTQWDFKTMFTDYRKRLATLTQEQKEKIKTYAIAGGCGVAALGAVLIGYKIFKKRNSGGNPPGPDGLGSGSGATPPPPPPPPGKGPKPSGHGTAISTPVPSTSNTAASGSPAAGKLIKKPDASPAAGAKDYRHSMVGVSSDDIKNTRKALRKVITFKPGQVTATNSPAQININQKILDPQEQELQKQIDEFLPQIKAHAVSLDALWDITEAFREKLLEGLPETKIKEIYLNRSKYLKLVFTYHFNTDATTLTDEEFQQKWNNISREQHELCHYHLILTSFSYYWLEYEEYLKTHNALFKESTPLDLLNHLLSVHAGHDIDLSEEGSSSPQHIASNDKFSVPDLVKAWNNKQPKL